MFDDDTVQRWCRVVRKYLGMEETPDRIRAAVAAEYARLLPKWTEDGYAPEDLVDFIADSPDHVIVAHFAGGS